MNKIFSVLLVLMLVATSFFVLFNSKNIFSDFKEDSVGWYGQATNFSIICYDGSLYNGSIPNDILETVLIFTYDDNSIREIDSGSINFSKSNPFALKFGI